MSPFSVCWFLLNKRWPTPFLRLKSFFEARFESCIDSVSQILAESRKILFVLCNCFPISILGAQFLQKFLAMLFSVQTDALGPEACALVQCFYQK